MDIESVDPRDWAIAQCRAEILSKLPERPSREGIRAAMAALGVGRTTLFRWLKQFREGARPSALPPGPEFRHAGVDAGSPRHRGETFP
jgi:transposase-like protein